MPIFNPTPPSKFLVSLFTNLPSNDGAVHITANTHLTADLHCTSLLVDAGVELFTDNYRIYCLGKVTNNGTISNNGANGGNGSAVAGGSAGTNPATHSLRQGWNGKAGVFNGSNGINNNGGYGQFGNNGSIGGDAGAFTGGTQTPGTILGNTAYFFSLYYLNFDLPKVISGALWNLFPNSGAASGAADVGAAGSGGSGAGGGIVFICATELENNGSIQAKGGLAGDPFDDGVTAVAGSSGGSGGLVLIYASVLTLGTISVSDGGNSSGIHGATDGGSPDSGIIFSSYMF